MNPFFRNIILFIGLPLTFLSSIWLKFVKKNETGSLGNKIFMYLGVFPILDHYYQPLINPKKYLTKTRTDRDLSAIDFNIEEQLSLLNKFNYNHELLEFPLNKRKEEEFFFNNWWFSSGDAEYLYNIIRYYKPKMIIEVGSGYCTLMAINAINKNRDEDSTYSCRHVCIEPYSKPWLENLGVELIREKVEDVDKTLFGKLQSNDIFFIDSSHIIRPQGDVLFEYLEVLPILNSGVLVHIHDIFTPLDYLDEWIYNHYMWNEQYLLEAFLIFNTQYRIIGSLNYLAHNYHDELAAKCPFYAKGMGYYNTKSEPRSFWMIRN